MEMKTVSVRPLDEAGDKQITYTRVIDGEASQIYAFIVDAKAGHVVRLDGITQIKTLIDELRQCVRDFESQKE
jgi:hypothetical protein